MAYIWEYPPGKLELELELYFYLNTVNLSDKIIIIIIIKIILGVCDNLWTGTN